MSEQLLILNGTLRNKLGAETVIIQRMRVRYTRDNLKGQSLMCRNDQSRDRAVDGDLIDQNVRLLFDGLASEELPDRFRELLALIRVEDHQQDEIRDDDA